MSKSVRVGKLKIGEGQPLAVIAGPCVIESEKHAMKMAERLSLVADDLRIPYIFKASYDKANRTSLGSYRGPGLARGLEFLGRIKRELGVPILTDVHSVEEVQRCGRGLRYPSDSRLPFTPNGPAAGGRPLRRRREYQEGPISFALGYRHAIEKARSTGNERILVTERGASFGYNNLVVDMRGLAVMKEFGAPVILDVTHSLQLPGGEGNRSGGQPQYIETLARAGVAAGVDGLFLEVHDNPARALSDGANSLELRRFKPLMARLRDLAEFVRKL